MSHSDERSLSEEISPIVMWRKVFTNTKMQMNKGEEKRGAELQNSEEQRQRRGVFGELLKKQLENLSPPEETGCDD